MAKNVERLTELAALYFGQHMKTGGTPVGLAEHLAANGVLAVDTLTDGELGEVHDNLYGMDHDNAAAKYVRAKLAAIALT